MEHKPRGGLRPDTLASSIVILLAVAVVQRSVGFGRGVLFCRWLDAESLGHWEMAYGFLLLAAPLAVLGLPGSFGRYLTRFSEQGRLRMFLRRTTAWTFALGAAAVTAMVLLREDFAYLVFGDSSNATLMAAVALCLGAVILHHFLEAVFAGLRLFRVVSTMHFFQSMAFAALALTLVATWRADALSVVVAYAAASALSAAGVLIWSAWHSAPEADVAPDTPHREFWPPLMRFAVWVWVANLLCNLFAVVDRYMIVHSGAFANDVALAEVGNYHASTIVPALLVSIANLVAGAMTPHLSHDWEAGRRSAVSDQLNLALKLAPLAMLAAGVAVLLLNPVLFSLVLEGRYASGRAVAPWTLAACVWFALLLIAQAYVWCAERTRLAAAPLAVGLLGNVGLNLLLLPRYGLLGAVVATALATLVALALQLYLNHRLGMRVSPAVLVLSLTPFALAGGMPTAAAGLAVACVGVAGTQALITNDEKRTLWMVASRHASRFSINRAPTPAS